MAGELTGTAAAPGLGSGYWGW